MLEFDIVNKTTATVADESDIVDPEAYDLPRLVFTLTYFQDMRGNSRLRTTTSKEGRGPRPVSSLTGTERRAGVFHRRCERGLNY